MRGKEGVSPAADRRATGLIDKRNFIVSNKGAFRRSDLILFVLVVVLLLVLVLGNQNFIEDEGRGRGRLEHL